MLTILCVIIIPSPHCYRSSTFTDSNRSVNIKYSQGGFSGRIGSDTLSFRTFVISNVSVVIIEESQNFFDSNSEWQGVLGLAFDSLLKVIMVT